MATGKAFTVTVLVTVEAPDEMAAWRLVNGMVDYMPNTNMRLVEIMVEKGTVQEADIGEDL